MKKNLMSVLIFALVLVNLAFTAIMAFSIIPSTKNANKLIEEVAQAIHLELNAGKSTGQNNVAMKNLQMYSVNNGENINILLKKGSDGKDHYAVVTAYVSVNKEHEDYATYGGDKMKEQDNAIRDAIMTAFAQYTKEEINELAVQEEVRVEITEKLQQLYDSDLIVGVGFASFLTQ